MKRILAILCAMACLFALALPAMAANTITVTAYVPADWNEANVYVWNDAGNNGEWPGSAMTKVEAGVFTLDIPTGYPNIIINGQGVQTADLKMSGEADVWVVFDGTNGSGSAFDSDPGKGAVSGGNTTPAPGGNGGDISGLNELYIVGSGMPGIGEWNTSDAAGKMTANGTTYTISLGLNKGTTIKFKFAGNGAWDSGFNYGGESPMEITAGTPVTLKNDGGSGDLSYTATQDCNLTITVDLAANTVKVEEVAGTPVIPAPPAPTFPESLYMAGQGIPGASGDWVEKDDAMALSGKDGVYSIAVNVTTGTSFEFKFTAGSWAVNYGGESAGVVVENNADVTLKQGGENLSYTAAADGTVTFTVDLNKNTLKVTGGGTVNPPAGDKDDTTGNTTGDKDETTQPTTAEDNKPAEKKDNTTLIIILAIVGVIAAGTAVAVVIILKKK